MRKSKKLLSALLALVIVLTAFPVMAFATSFQDRPANGTTEDQPFVTNKPSQYYRIPAVVTLSDGTLVAAADARWNAQMDGGGNDVIVTRSTNNGKTWNYSLLNYFGDNGNVFNKSSTSFCDSEIATDGTNVYLLSTFFPAGYAINGSSSNYRPSTENAFDSQGRLLLKRTGESSYAYWLDTGTKDSNGRYVIRTIANNSIMSDATVNEEFYLFNASGDRTGSIFFSDGSYQTAKTTFLWFRSSPDGGVTWNAPKLLNVKNSGEMFLGVGPGRGLVTSKGDILFTTYTYGGSSDSQRTYLISSSDGGNTWKRSSANATNNQWWTSESCAVELPNGTIRCYLRNGSKLISEADATRNADGSYSWTRWDRTKVNGATIDCWSDCQVSALMYPYKINGKNAVLVSCPTNNSSSRKNGTIHLMLLDDNNNCVERFTKAITAVNVDYQYSSMDVLDNGNIALLFESGNAIHYKEVSIHDIATGATVSIPEVKNITLASGETYSFKSDTNSFGNYDKKVIQITSSSVPSAKAQLGTDNNYNGQKISLSDALYHFTYSGSVYAAESTNGTNLYLDPIANTSAGLPHRDVSSTIRIENARDAGADTFYLSSNSTDSGGNYPYLMFWKGTSHDQTFDRWGVSPGQTIADASTNDNNIINNMGGSLKKGAEMNLFRPVQSGETSSTEIPGYIKVPDLASIKSGENYLVAYKANNGSYYVAYASTSTNKFAHVAKVLPDETETNGYNVTVTALNDGVTVFKAGDTTYKFTVSNAVAVTGAVKYDPVIYTQGGNFKSFGTTISEGATTAERKTTYQVAPGYSIDYIEVMEGVVAAGTSITAENGILKGTVQLTAGNNSISVYEKIKIKTFLNGPNGKKYTQENYLYVTTSPVPAHVVSITNSYYQNWQGTQWITVAPMGLIAKGSTSSYNTTDYQTSPSSNNEGRNANSIDLFNEDSMSLGSFASISNPIHNPNTAVTFTGDKLGGWYGYKSDKVSQDHGGPIVEGAFTGTTGHYYYDKSSTINPGFKSSNGNTAQIELVLNRPTIITSGDYVHDNDKFDINDFNITLGGVTKVLSQQNSTPTVPGVSPVFKVFKYPAGNNGLQTFTVDVDTSTTGTINGNMYIKVSHGRGSDGAWWALNYTTLPLQIHVADKSTVRTAYNNAITNSGASDWDVLVSSDYTLDTWNEYQRQMLNAESYLNNYSYKQIQPTDLNNYGGKLKTAYDGLQKIADFSELEEQLELKQSLFGVDFPFDESGHNLYTRTSWDNFQLNYKQGDDYCNKTYPTYEQRIRTAGYNPTGKEGPHSATLTSVQNNINIYTENIRNNPQEIADPTVYEAAKEIVATLDLDAYKDTVADTLINTMTTGDAAIYEEGQVNKIVKIAKTNQADVDGYTTTLVENMNIANDTASASDANKGRHTTVIFKVNGSEVLNAQYGYGVSLAFTVVPQWITAEQAKTAIVKIENDGITQTEIPMPDNYKIKFVARGNITTVNIITANSPNVIVRDYFGTIIYSGTATEEQIVMDNSNATVTINGTLVTAKSSPALRFKSWELTHEADGSICVIQKGTRIGDTHAFEATNGIITRYNSTEPITSLTGYGVPYTVTPNDGVTPIVWKMTVDGKEYLAAYESSFTRFAYNQDTVYTAITSEDELGALASAYGKPVSFGTGFISGDNSDKFTLACSYSAAPGTTIAEAGVLYSTNGDLTPATMTKGADGVSTKIQTRVSDFGTYTMTKKDALTGTHLMRSYVSYTEVVDGKTVIRVSYGPVYQCVDGQISIVE